MQHEFSPAESDKALPTSTWETLPVTLLAEPVQAVTWQDRPQRWRKILQRQQWTPVLNAQKQVEAILSSEYLGLSPQIARQAWDALRQTDTPPPPLFVLRHTDTCRQARQAFQDSPWPYIPIVNAQGRYQGECASRVQLDQCLYGDLRPRRVGGLATPLGVYLTSGYYSAGAGWPGLLATGALLALVADIVDMSRLVLYSALVAVFPLLSRLDASSTILCKSTLMLMLVLALLRLSPIAGLHAAEHMTVHALEQHLPLTPEWVGQQPRVHPRCGTNLMPLIMGAQWIGFCIYLNWHAISPWGLMLYALSLAALIFYGWKPAGRFLQANFTTRPPTQAQLASGIRAGESLLRQYRRAPHAKPGWFRRIWSAGLLQVIAAFMLVSWLLDVGRQWLGWMQ